MRFIIGFLVTIGLLIFVFVLIFRGGGNDDQPSKAGTKLLDYANSTSVAMQFTEVGPVVADTEHGEVRVTIGSTESSVEVFRGYQQTLVRSKTYANNSEAYADFLKALDLAGYTLGNTDKSVADERGYCATGHRYVFGIKDGSRDVQRFWSSSCGTGTFKSKPSPIRSLFLAQIPDYGLQTKGAF